MRIEVAAANHTYRDDYRTWLLRVFHGKNLEDVRKLAAQAMQKFKSSCQPLDAGIHFVGAWNTADSVGGPFHISGFINTFIHRFKFPDLKLSDKMDYAVQALSTPEKRCGPTNMRTNRCPSGD